jgi:hypothetical protein
MYCSANPQKDKEMPITKYITITLLIATSLLYAACKKKSLPAVNPSAVTIIVASPQKGQLYHKGDTVNINFNVSYTTELHGYYLQLIDTATFRSLYESAEDIHNDHFSVQLQWVDTCSTAKNLEMIISANLDHTGTEASDTVWIATAP